MRISIYRLDPHDPLSINVDTYSIWESLPPHLDVSRMIGAAATTINSNFEMYAQGHVFIVKDDPGEDHWLDQLPPDVRIVISTSN